MLNRPIALLAAGSLLAGCATAPRPMNPAVAAAEGRTMLPAEVEAVVNKCKVMVAEGRRSDFAGNVASAGAGVAATTGFAATAGGALMYASAATIVGALTGVGVLAAFGVSRAVRSSKEREVKTAAETCLREHGLVVTDWELVKRSQ